MLLPGFFGASALAFGVVGVLGSGFRVSGVGSQVFRLRALRLKDSGFLFYDLGSRILGFGFRLLIQWPE